MMRAGDYAWVALAVSVAVYEWLAPPNELMSQACDRYRSRRPIATYTAIVYLAAHLGRVWPRRIDPLYLIAERAKGAR